MKQKINPLVSVLMTAYNADKYISLAIESILEQTYQNFEFIIIEDASNDNTWDVIQTYAKKDKRIIATRNEINLNAGGSSNKGLKICKGKYIIRMDADDWSFPYRIEKQVKYMEGNEGVVCSGGSMVVCNEEMKKIGVRNYPENNERILETILRLNPVPHPSSIWRRDAIKKTKGYPTKLGMSEDYFLVLEISQHGELGNIREKLIKYRVHKKSESNSKMRRQQLITVYLSFKAEFEYKYKPKFKDHLWRTIQVLTIYTLPVSVKRALFNLITLERD